MFAVYTFQSFTSLSSRKRAAERNGIFALQRFEIFLISFLGFFALFVANPDRSLVAFYLLTIALYVFIEFIYNTFYHNAPKLLINNLCMLLNIGFLMLARLNLTNAYKQLLIAAVSAFGMMLIPLLIRKLSFLDKLTWVYALIGIVSMGMVLVLGAISYGAKLSISIGGFAIQPSELIKIVFVFFVASLLSRKNDFKTIVIATCVAALHVLILVASRDLGAALLFYMTYLVMLYAATRQIRYFFAGLGLGALGSVAAYFMFSHVRVRVIAWRDPFSVIDDSGYQIAQSLFAIGSGGWFGSGLGQGRPDSIPVVISDFIFAAISEELGGIFAICLVLICICVFFLFLNIALQIHRRFYKLIALGLGTVYMFQVLLSVGGVTKFIPSTGVTLPLVSYGGSSLLSTFIIFNIIMGLYLYKEDEADGTVRKKEQARIQRRLRSDRSKRRYEDIEDLN